MREAATVGRPREFDAEAALATIMEVFWQKGYEGASMRDLTDATGLKKGSLYAAFGNKRAMYHQALALYDRIWIDATVRALEGAGTPRARIDRFLQSAIGAGADESRGCFVCNASLDQAALDPAAGKLVRASLGRLERALAVVAAENGASSPAATRRARHLMSVYFGLRVLATADAEVQFMKDAKRAALGTLDSA